MFLVQPLASAIRHSLFISLCSLSTITISQITFANTSAHSQYYQINAGALDQVLTHFAAQAGVSLAFDQAQVAKYSSVGLNGTYSVEMGFKQILATYPFRLEKTNAGYQLITLNTPNQAKDMGQLKQIEIATSADAGQKVNQLPVITVQAENDSAPLNRKAQIGALGNMTAFETPFSITIANREQLDERQAIDLKDALIGDTSIVSGTSSYNTSNRGRFMIIRGMYTEEGSNYKLNGMDAGTVNLPLEIMESVQVLKGATGFMYGFAVPSGVIDYQTKKPTDELYRSASIGYRSSSIINAQVDIGDRLGPEQQFGYRINAFTEDGEVYNGSKVDRKLVSGAFDYKLTDNLIFTVDAVKQNYDIDQEIAKLMPNTSTTLPKALKGDSKLIFDGTYTNTDLTYFSTGLAWYLNPAWLAKFNYSYTEYNNEFNNAWLNILNASGDYTIAQNNGFNASKNNLWQGIISGEFDTWGISHNLNAGIVLSKKENYRGKFGKWEYLEGKSGNLYTPVNTVFPATNTGDASYKSGQTDQKAIYFVDTVHFLPNWSAMIGGRYTDYESKNIAQSGSIINKPYSTENFSPSFALMYHPRDHLNIYASYVEALEAGEIVGDDYLNKGNILDATVSKAYELGLKYMAEQWSITPALYRVEQTSTIDQYINNDIAQKYRVQDGITLYEGVDIQGEFMATEHLRLRAGANFADPRLDKLNSKTQYLKGRRPSSASKQQFSLQVDYDIPQVEGLSAHTDIRYYGNQYQSMPPVDLLYPSYTIWNVGGAYKTKISEYDVIIRADFKNVLDKAYWANSGIGEPRSLALSIKSSF